MYQDARTFSCSRKVIVGPLSVPPPVLESLSLAVAFRLVVESSNEPRLSFSGLTPILSSPPPLISASRSKDSSTSRRAKLLIRWGPSGVVVRSSWAVTVRALLRRRGIGEGVATGAEDGLEDIVFDEPEGFRVPGPGDANEDWYEPKDTSCGRDWPDASPRWSLNRPARPRTDMVTARGCPLSLLKLR